jgi:hypothetical protein
MAMRYRLRTLLIVLAVLPPLLAWTWSEYARFRTREQQRAAAASQFSIPAGRGFRIVIPAANPASSDLSNEQVFSFHVGFQR